MPTYEKPQPAKQFDSGEFPTGSWMRVIAVPDRRWTPGTGETEDDRPDALQVQLWLNDEDGQQVTYGTAYLDEVGGSPNAIENALPNVVEKILQAKGFTQV